MLEDSPYLKAKAGGTTVLMGTQQRGQIRSDGSYVPGTALYPYEFKLEKVDGNWRIDNPPPGVFVEASTFSAAFRPYTVYFLNSTRNRVVPDVRWYAAASDALPNILFTAIEKGPSAWLTGAVRSDLEGATLQSNVEQVGDRVKVYLTGLAEGVDTLSDGAFAQLVWTLNQLGVGGVEVYIDGRQVGPRSAPDRSLQRLSDWRGFDPEGMPASTLGYFIKDGAVWTTKDAPLAGPAGTTGLRRHVGGGVHGRAVPGRRPAGPPGWPNPLRGHRSRSPGDRQRPDPDCAHLGVGGGRGVDGA